MNTILAERGKTHGDFSVISRVWMNIIRAMEASPNWATLSDDVKSSLLMDTHKTARILCGDQTFPDHWADKAGYATLVERLYK